MSSETFISNFHELKQKLRVPLPNDEIVFQCEQCHGNIAFNYEGVIEFDEMMDKELSSYVDHMILATIKAHKTQNAKCAPSNVRIHPVLGAPRNLIFSFYIPSLYIWCQGQYQLLGFRNIHLHPEFHHY